MSVASSVALLSLALAPAPQAANEVHVVDALGLGEYVQIQTAIDAAAEGDAILVRSGTYDGFEVHDLSISIFADEGAEVFTAGVLVADLDAARTVVLSGLSIEGHDAPGLWLSACEGAVRVEACTITGGESTGPGLGYGWAGLRVDDCPNVVVGSATLTGGENHPDVAGSGLEANSSRVALYDVLSFGARGTFAYMAGDGGSGALLDASFLFTSGCLLRAGDGGPATDCGYTGRGGDGLLARSASHAALLDTTVQAGNGACVHCLFCTCCEPPVPGFQFNLLDGSSIERIFESARSVSGTRVVPEGGTGSRTYVGQVGDEVRMAIGMPAFRFLRVYNGVLALGFPLRVPLQPDGILPAGGTLTVDEVTPALPSSVEGALLLGQSYFGGNGRHIGPTAARLISREPDCNANGVPDPLDVAAGRSEDVNGNGVPDECESVTLRLYVDADRTGPSDGMSWQTAYARLEAALTVAATRSPLATDIWVAEGTYLPPSVFQVPAGTSVYGGFEGDEADLAEREMDLHVTVLSADLLADDAAGFENRADNLLNIVVTGGADTRLDGLHLRGANVGALVVEPGGTVVVGCRFSDNAGRAVRVDEASSVRFQGCHFVDGAGIEVLSDGAERSLFSECVFVGSTALNSLFVVRNTTLLNCLISGNTVSATGLVHALGGVDLVQCTIQGNRADVAFGDGSALYAGADTTVQNCIFWGNRDGAFFGEAAQLRAAPGAVITAVRCHIQNLDSLAGNHNSGDYPRFVDPVGPDGVTGTLDDDLRLDAGSTCIDSGRNQALPQDTHDLDGDGRVFELWPVDLDGAPRRQDDPAWPDDAFDEPPVVDRGCYERAGAP